MSKMRLRFASLVALCCFALATFGVAQQNQATSNGSNYPKDAQAAQNTPSQPGPSSGSSQISAPSKQFLKQMAKDSQGEVQLAQMAQQKASSQQVKDFAQKLVSDHQNLDQQLESFMSQNGMKMPQPMTAEQRQLQTQLQNLTGAQFDKAFVDGAVQGHEKDVSEVQQHIQSAQNDQVKTLLQNALPVLQQHLQMAKQLQSQLGSGR